MNLAANVIPYFCVILTTKFISDIILLIQDHFPVVFEFVVFDCVLRCVAVPVAGSHSKCAGLTRSRETVSTLPLIRIFMTLPLLTMTLYGPS